ncbi:MAG: exosortase/archaeosortase family protein [Chlorobi bacterium]|nr:exosortase/archaeosortase family protein [Chlorobiota bacterium]
MENFPVIKTYYSQARSFIDKYKLQPLLDVIIFMVIIVFFHFLWWNFGLKKLMLEYLSFSNLEQYMAHQVAVPSAWFVKHIIGYDIKTLETTLYFPNNGYIAVEGSCSGLKQFYQWIVLMLLFPGPWKHKLWYIPMGLIVIHLTNIFRIIVLSVVVMHWPQQWDFIHLWIMRPFFYVIIFIMWMFWEEKFRLPKKKTSGLLKERNGQ